MKTLNDLPYNPDTVHELLKQVANNLFVAPDKDNPDIYRMLIATYDGGHDSGGHRLDVEFENELTDVILRMVPNPRRLLEDYDKHRYKIGTVKYRPVTTANDFLNVLDNLIHNTLAYYGYATEFEVEGKVYYDLNTKSLIIDGVEKHDDCDYDEMGEPIGDPLDAMREEPRFEEHSVADRLATLKGSNLFGWDYDHPKNPDLTNVTIEE